MAKLRDVLIVILLLLIFGVTCFLMLQPKEKQTVRVPVTVEVILPEIKGTSDTIYVDSIVYRDRVKIDTLDPNKKLLEQYISSQDSIAKLNMYIAAITEHIYTTTFPDTIQDIIVRSRVRGELLEQSISYTIHKQTKKVDTEIDVPVKKRIEFYGLAEVGLPVYPLQQQLHVNGDDIWLPRNQGLNVKATLLMKNKRDGLFSSLSFDSQLRGYLGYGIKF